LTLFAYAITPPTNTSLDPAMSVSRAPIRPPVQDSAVARVNPRSRQRSSTIAATGAARRRARQDAATELRFLSQLEIYFSNY
jgi:hypothetical protein